MESSYPAANHGDVSGFDPGLFPSSSGFRSPTSYSHDVPRRSFSSLDAFVDHAFVDPHRRFKPPSDAGVASDPYPEVSGAPGVHEFL